MGLFDIFDGKEEEKGESADPKKLIKPPSGEYWSNFERIGNCIVRPEKVQAISVDPKKHEISIALDCGETWFYSTDESRFNASLDQIQRIFNIDIKEA